MAYSVGAPTFVIKSMIIAQILQILFSVTFAVDPDCNYYQQINPGVNYYVYNKEYPKNFSGNKQCRWIAIAPDEYTIEATCQIEMPASQYCNRERLLISLTGDPNLNDSKWYCGVANISLVTLFNKISIGLVTKYNTPGGRFLCTLVAKPVEYGCDCGSKNTRRIVGGIETGIHEFPMMAGIVDFINEDIFCGATIIARKYAVSAAHCFKNRNIKKMGILVGAHNISSINNSTKLILLANITIHPDYVQDAPKGYNDIAIMKTQQNIEFNIDVGPVCLPFLYYKDSFAGKIVDVLGWGTTEFTGPKSDVLLKTDMNVESVNDCYSKVGGIYNQICTFMKGHDSCQSDSGGPVLWLDPNTMRVQLVGVVSHGQGCASSQPSINTRVTSYLSWIEFVTPGAEYCMK